MTLALLVLGGFLVAFLAYRLIRLPAALDARPQALLDAPSALTLTAHTVWAGPLEYNGHGFITTARVPCMDPACFCRNMKLITGGADALKN